MNTCLIYWVTIIHTPIHYSYTITRDIKTLTSPLYENVVGMFVLCKINFDYVDYHVFTGERVWFGMLSGSSSYPFITHSIRAICSGLITLSHYHRHLSDILHSSTQENLPRACLQSRNQTFFQLTVSSLQSNVIVVPTYNLSVWRPYGTS